MATTTLRSRHVTTSHGVSTKREYEWLKVGSRGKSVSHHLVTQLLFGTNSDFIKTREGKSQCKGTLLSPQSSIFQC